LWVQRKPEGKRELFDEQLAGSEKTTGQWCAELPVPDQVQLRKFYLTAIEAVDPGLREKYAKIYRYYLGIEQWRKRNLTAASRT
jgi:hypothetical protein